MRIVAIVLFIREIILEWKLCLTELVFLINMGIVNARLPLCLVSLSRKSMATALENIAGCPNVCCDFQHSEMLPDKGGRLLYMLCCWDLIKNSIPGQLSRTASHTSSWRSFADNVGRSESTLLNFLCTNSWCLPKTPVLLAGHVHIPVSP